MMKYTKEQINEQRKKFIDSGFEKTEAAISSRRFSYFTLPQSLNPALPDFAFRMTEDSKDNYILGVSGSLSEEYRKYVALHEYIEFMEIGADIAKPENKQDMFLVLLLGVKQNHIQIPLFDDYKSGRCLEAAKEEWAWVPEEIKKEYAAVRTRFFENLIAYASDSGNKSFFTDDDIKEFEKSYAFFGNLLWTMETS